MNISQDIKKNLQDFLNEDTGNDNDITTRAILSQPNQEAFSFSIKSKNSDPFILCGVELIEAIFQLTNSKYTIKTSLKDGALVNHNDKIIEGKITPSTFLTLERVILNLIQHLSAISTKTDQWKQLIKNKHIKLLDTRKTIPGLRALQKYAVKTGGGTNHRLNLSDMFLIKDNHIVYAKGVENSIKQITKYKKEHGLETLKVEIECETISDVKNALKHANLINIIMLDNMELEKMKECITLIRKQKSHIKIEVSGGCNISNIPLYSSLDIDYISSGELTNSIKAVDISAQIKIK